MYKADARYTPGAASMFSLDLAPPADIADALRGEQWAFVQLPLATLREEATAVATGGAFGAALPGLAALCLPDSTSVPGVAVFSRRAAPLAAWTNGLELACVKADVDRACLLLEAGVRDRYRYGAWRRSPAADDEARSWEAAKERTGGLHFLAVQTHPDAESVTGLWLMRDVPLPAV